jgi:magnesium chelatase subunit D
MALERLPVGGRTPLSTGLSKARDVFKKYALKMKNEVLLLVVISDGKANVSMKPARSHEELRNEIISSSKSAGGCGSPSLHDLVSSYALQEALEVGEEIKHSGIKSLIIDTANSSTKDRMQRLGASMGGLYFKMEELRAEGLVEVVNASLNRPNNIMVALP